MQNKSKWIYSIMFSNVYNTSFNDIKNKHGLYRNKDCMKMFYEFLKEYTVEIIDFKKKKTKSSTNEQQKSCQNATACYIC